MSPIDSHRVTLLGDPVLRQKCRPITDPQSHEVENLAAKLRDTLYEVREEMGFGRGIAAPQVGEPVRAVFICIDEPVTLLNPTIVGRSGEMFELWDDCFSVPSLLVRVRRRRRILVRYTDLAGESQVLEARDDLSELLQHELDHLDGKLILDRALDKNAVYHRDEWDRQFGDE